MKFPRKVVSVEKVGNHWRISFPEWRGQYIEVFFTPFRGNRYAGDIISLPNILRDMSPAPGLPTLGELEEKYNRR